MSGRAQDMAGSKKQKKRDYLHDFKQSAGGSYVYTGVTWHADPVLWRRMFVKLWVLQAVMLLCVCLPGFLTTAGLLNTFYVIIPYVFWFISNIVLTYTLGSITFGGNPLRDYIYQRSVTQYALRTAFPLAGAALTAFSLTVFLIRGGSGEGVVLCFICCVIQIAVSFTANRTRMIDIWTC